MKQTFINILTPEKDYDSNQQMIDSGLIKIEREYTWEFENPECRWTLIDKKDRYFYNDGKILHNSAAFKKKTYGINYL